MEMAAAILGVLKAGGVYVPLDPEDPRERLDFFVADSRPAAIVTTTALAERFSAGDAQVIRLDADAATVSPRQSESNPACQTGPENAVFVLYTSGSTGKPKGAVNLHRGIANYLLWKRENLGLGPDDRVLLTTPLSFDTSVEEFFSGTGLRRLSGDRQAGEPTRAGLPAQADRPRGRDDRLFRPLDAADTAGARRDCRSAARCGGSSAAARRSRPI